MSELTTDAPRLCPVCGNHRTRVVGHAEPPSLLLRCEVCGRVSLIAGDKDLESDDEDPETPVSLLVK